MSTRRLEIWLLGDRGFPQGKVTVPEGLVGDLPGLLAACQQVQPALDMNALLQPIWQFGAAGVRHRLDRHIPIKPEPSR